jgi:hypothetical protein
MKAAAYRRNDGTYFHSSSLTESGFWVSTAPFLKVKLGSPLAALGETAITVLGASRESIPDLRRDEWSHVFDPMLELAGVTSWEAFKRTAVDLSLESKGGRIRVIPGRDLGPDEGFEQIPEKAVELSAGATPEDVGAAIEEAVARCERTTS